MNKFLKIIKEMAIYAIIIIALIYAIPKGLIHILKTDYPMASITSSSMWPSLKQNDLVFIKAVDKSELDIGDVVVYENRIGFTIHRIIELNDNKLITKGDANNVNDSPIGYDKIVGRVVKIKEKPLRIPYLGMISVLVSNYKAS